MVRPLIVNQKKRSGSAKVAAAVERRSLTAPIVVQGISRGTLTTIEPPDFAKLDIDASYQRGETQMVGEIVRALQSGGQIFDPVTLCRRPWDGNKNKLWIIDGHQRVCAAQELRVPIPAIVHESSSLDSEKVFFLALNARRGVSADNIVKSWTGPAGDLVARANTDPDHPLFGRIHFQQGQNKGKVSASTAARGALTAATGSVRSGTILRILARLDTSMCQRADRARAEHFLRLLGYVFPSGSVPSLAALAIGIVANQRWAKEFEPPSTKTIQKLRLIKWGQEVPSLSKKFLPVLVELARKAWK